MLFDLLISPAYAQTAQAQPSLLMNLAPLALIFGVMYFFMIRPQQKRAKEHRAMVENLRRGDRVLALGGLIGTVSKVIDDKEIDMTVGTAELRVLKTSINQVLDKSVEDTEEKRSKIKVVSTLKK